MTNIVIFGASGNLTKVKIFPALWDIFKLGYKGKYIGYGRTVLLGHEFMQRVKEAVPDASNDFLSNFSYVSGDYSFADLKKLKTHISQDRTIFYLALPTRVDVIGELVHGLKQLDFFNNEFQLVIEKPFGDDYDSALKLMTFLRQEVGEDHLFLVDHYLAKSLVRNLISLRFANPIFENMWSNKFINKIEINALETVGIEGRGEYYDSVGAIKDMIQNHVLQMLSIVLMNSPEEFNFESIVNEKKNVLENLNMFDKEFSGNVKIGQYNGYLEEEMVAKNSLTETYVSLKVEVANERWMNVPIVLKTGKRMKQKKTQIALFFNGFDKCLWNKNCSLSTQNKLEINIYPENDIRLYINSNIYSGKSQLNAIPLVLDLNDKEKSLSPYANALLDVYNNDKSYTPSIDEILLSWKFVDGLSNWLLGKRKALLEISSY